MATIPLIAECRPERPTARGSSLARGVALFIGGFTLLNLATDLRAPALDANIWWVDLRFLPALISKVVLGCGAIIFMAYGINPCLSRWRRRITFGSALGLGLSTLVNCIQFYVLCERELISSKVPVPFSLIVSTGLLWIAWHAAESSPRQNRQGHRIAIAFVVIGCSVGFPLLQMFCFGKTDYRRSAEAAVVFGARVYADGRPSDALADRVRTGCELYHQKLVRKLIFSGGPGDGPVHETESMRRMAIRLGVPGEDILLDREGLNTLATARNTEPLFRKWHNPRVLVVSHFYHLPRIKLTYQRDGFEVYTVPAKESYFLRQIPYNMLREIAALWVYYARPLRGLLSV